LFAFARELRQPGEHAAIHAELAAVAERLA
jgi:hypothetical protein